MKTVIDLNELLIDAEDEIDLLPYFVKLELTRLGVPVNIDPVNIRDPDIIVDVGELSYVINVDTMIMEIAYHD